MSRSFSKFTNQYSLSKTLRFELRPKGATKERFEQEGENPLQKIIKEDEERAEKYKEAKSLIDDIHRDFLSIALAEENVGPSADQFTEPLEKAYQAWSKSKKLKKDSKGKKLDSQGLKKANDDFQKAQKTLAQNLQALLDTNFAIFKEKKLLTQFSKVESKIESNRNGLNRLTKGEEYETEKKRLNREIKLLEKCLKEIPGYNKAGALYGKTESLFHILMVYYVHNEEKFETIRYFDGFHTYFTGFNENRKNVYSISSKDKKESFISTSIAHRLFEQNLSFHFENIRDWETIQKSLKDPKNQESWKKRGWNWDEKLKEIERELDFSAKEFFQVEPFWKYFSQEGTDRYNEIIGGRPAEAGSKKQQGLNELINLARQNSEKGQRRDFPPLQELYKQILSDKEKNFIPVYETDEQMVSEIREFADREEKIFSDIKKGTQESDLPVDPPEVFFEASREHKDNIFLSEESLRKISNEITGRWNAITHWYLNTLKTDTEKQKANKRKSFTIAELEESFKEKLERENEEKDFYDTHIKDQWKEQIDRNNIFLSYFEQGLEKIIKDQSGKNKNFKETDLLDTNKKLVKNQNNGDAKKKIKIYLDGAIDVFHFLKILHVKEKDLPKGQEQDEDWKKQIDGWMNPYNTEPPLIKIYNKTRNYLTKKPYSIEKYKLNFENSTLADGWDRNKESDNTALIFKKEGLFYLGIMDKRHNKIFETLNKEEIEKIIENEKQSLEEDKKNLEKNKKGSEKALRQKILLATEKISDLGLLLQNTDDCYQKMNYKLLPGPNKMLPKVFFAKSNEDLFQPPEEIEKIKKDKLYSKKNIETYGITNLHKYIDFCKKSLLEHPEWKEAFGFSDHLFRNTKDYESVDQFYREVETRGYKVTFDPVPQAYINAKVERGELSLFQIYNKDFSPHSKGRENLHTTYWKLLFDETNLKDVVCKLNGEAELFYRKSSLDQKVTHPKGTPIKNRNPLNGKKESTFEYDIIKDKRYTQNKLFFHCSINLNFKASGTGYLNPKINCLLKKERDVNILGIDRGEKHLLYYSLIRPDGEIIEQGSLNTIEASYLGKNKEPFSTNYQAKLDEKEKDKARAREKWEEIGNIKELKAGYLSQVVHKLSKLIVENNSIVVLENLNQGFKRGRFKVEKQVYQKFERALIDKLNYLVLKDTPADKVGHYLRAYQLTNKFESFQKLGTQSGILFYVTASYTSKVDPITGYIQNLYPKQGEKIEKIQEFFKKFDSIKYNGDYFEFTYDLKKLKGITGSYDEDDSKLPDKTNWTVGSCVERSRYVPLEKQKTEPSSNDQESGRRGKHEIFKVNDELKELFKGKISYPKDEELKDKISSSDDEKFLKSLMYYLGSILRLRVTDDSKEKGSSENDFIQSPVAPFYDSRKITGEGKGLLPDNGDANGAYNIARKGIMILEQLRQGKVDETEVKTINKQAWQNFSQREEVVQRQIEKYKLYKDKK